MLAELHEVAGDLDREDRPDGVLVQRARPCRARAPIRGLCAERRGRPRRRADDGFTLRVELLTTRLRDDALLPTRAHDGDAGLDLYAADAATIGPGERATRRHRHRRRDPRRATPGSSCRAPGSAARHGIALVNAPGLIDSGYRGEIRVLLLNTDRDGVLRPFPLAIGSPSSC